MGIRHGPDLPQSPLVSCHYYAKANGVDPKDMRRSLKAVGIRGRFDPADADRLLAKAKSARHQRDDPSDKESYSEADRRWKCARAAQEELKLKKIQGILVLRAQVEKETFDAVRSCRDRLFNLPARLSALIAAEPDPRKVHAILARELTQAFEELPDEA